MTVEVLSDNSTNDDKALSFTTKAAKIEHDKIVDWTLSVLKDIRNDRNATERQWYMNLAFYAGKQYVQLLRPEVTNAGVSTRLIVPKAAPWRVRPSINKIRPTIRAELSKLTSNRPNASVVPASSEDRDMYAAMAGEQIWDHYYTEHKLKAIIRRAMWWTVTCGNGFIKAYWDASKGEPMMDPRDGSPVLDATTGEQALSGDMCYTQETPFHVLCPDLREEDLENQPYLIHAQVKSTEWAKMHFTHALDGTEISFGNANSGQELLEDTFLNITGTPNPSRRNTVMVMEVWIKPGQVPQFPEGAYYTIIENKIVQGAQGWPFEHGKFPFAKFDHIPSGKFYSTSVVEDLIPLQKEYNRTRGQIIEAKNRMAKPQLSAPRGSIDASKVTSEPGQILFYTPGFNPPTPIPLVALPAYVLQEIDRIQKDWDDISGQHEISKGHVPPGVTAATAISYLQEQDESKLAPTFDSLEEGIEKIATMTLSSVQQFWDEERVIKITGPDGSFDAAAFKGSDLKNNVDIRVEGGSSLPNSKAAKQALIMDMMKMGFIDPRKGLEVMDMGGINKLYEQIQTDQRQAQRENMRMSKVTEEDLMIYNQQNQQMLAEDPNAFDGGMPPLVVPVNTWDNHKLHVEYHNNFRKSQAFEVLDKATKALFEAHVQMHIMAMGMESVTMDPRAAAGLPPDPAAEDPNNQGEQQQPGPEPMPQPMQPEGAPA